MSEYMKAPTEEQQIAVINRWIDVRDVARFPFRKETGDGKKLSETGIRDAIAGKGDVDADTEVEGGVPVDDGADG